MTADKPIAQMDALDLERKRLELEERRIVAQERMLALQESQAASLATQVERTAPKENPNYVARSPYLQPNGEPWAKTLKCAIYQGSIDLRDTPLTKAEVDMLNRIEPKERIVISKVDNSTATMSILGTRNAEGVIDSLRLMLPMSKDSNPQHYPPLVELARQMADQSSQKGASA